MRAADVTGVRKASYLVFAAFACLILYLHLGPMLLAGLFSYLILDVTYRKLGLNRLGWWGKWVALVLFAGVAALFSYALALFSTLAVDRAPALFDTLLPKTQAFVQRLKVFADDHHLNLPLEDPSAIRAFVIDAVKGNATAITRASGLLTKGFLLIAASIAIAVFSFVGKAHRSGKRTLWGAIEEELSQRTDLFMKSFETILGAQVLISLINAVITAVYLYAFGVPSPKFLILAAFVLGMIPVVGFIIGNILILGAALTVSFKLALGTLIFLSISHHLQYPVSGRVIGSRTNLPTWQVLAGLVAGELIMGVAGLILAPAVIHYVRQELSLIEWQ